MYGIKLYEFNSDRLDWDRVEVIKETEDNTICKTWQGLASCLEYEKDDPYSGNYTYYVKGEKISKKVFHDILNGRH